MSNFRQTEKNSGMWSSIVFECDSTPILCAQLSSEDSNACSNAFSNFLTTPTGFPTFDPATVVEPLPTLTPTSSVTVQYCANIKSNEANHAVGYFAMEISEGQAFYRFYLDLTLFEVDGSCSLPGNGLNYHINSFWLNDSSSSSAGSQYCGSSVTGGHYDPNYACSNFSQNINSGCDQLGRIASDGYTYTCNPSIYAPGDYSECEVGDLSGKFGTIYPKKGKMIFESDVLIDYYPPFISNYEAMVKNSVYKWSSVVFSCGSGINLLCAKLSTTELSTCSSTFEAFPNDPTTFPTASLWPTVSPTSSPSLLSSHQPSQIPTQNPSEEPTINPTTSLPSTAHPSNMPTRVPTSSRFPSVFPTCKPTSLPTVSPSSLASQSSTVLPTSLSPTPFPSSKKPSVKPSSTSPSIFTYPPTVATDVRYCATISPNDANNAQGYFAMNIINGIGIYQFHLDLTSIGTSLGGCSLSSSGLRFQIHSKWLNSSVSSSAGSNFCGISYTGGNYDPNYACSTSSQNINTECEQLQRTSANGYSYTCSSIVYGLGQYATCEVGDLSGKFGIVYPAKNTKVFTTIEIVDFFPPLIANFQNTVNDANMWSSIVFGCGSTTTPIVCAKISATDTAACDNAFNNFLQYPTEFPTESPATPFRTVPPTALSTTPVTSQYCATVRSYESNQASGYFAMEITQGQALYQFKLNLTSYQSLANCDLSNGLEYQLYTYWLNSSVSSSAGSTYCGSAFTGGHYDPDYACSAYSQNINSGCVQLQRVAANGYTYKCNATEYATGNYEECEVGDLSGKFGTVYPIDGSSIFISDVFTDYFPPYITNYLASEKNSPNMWSSVVFQCGSSAETKLVCAKLSSSDFSACNSIFETFPNNPTPSPTTIPTRCPTSVPSRRPTAKPSLKPSAGPTSRPTQSPKPSVLKSSAPSLQPSSTFPTLTFIPSSVPSSYSTSCKPVTATPTVQASIVSFSTTISLLNVTGSSTLDINAQSSLIAATANAFNISSSYIVFVSSSPSSITPSLVIMGSVSAPINVNANVFTSISLSGIFADVNASALYASLMSNLNVSVNSGLMTTYLRSASTTYNAAATKNAEVVGAVSSNIQYVTFSSPPSVIPTSSSPSSQPISFSPSLLPTSVSPSFAPAIGIPTRLPSVKNSPTVGLPTPYPLILPSLVPTNSSESNVPVFESNKNVIAVTVVVSIVFGFLFGILVTAGLFYFIVIPKYKKLLLLQTNPSIVDSLNFTRIYSNNASLNQISGVNMISTPASSPRNSGPRRHSKDKEKDNVDSEIANDKEKDKSSSPVGSPREKIKSSTQVSSPREKHKDKEKKKVDKGENDRKSKSKSTKY